MFDLSSIGDLLYRLGSFLVVIGIIVLVHELGHFLAARSVGIRVIRFSIGFPPKILSWRRGKTDYQIGMIPVGGYVKMAGIIDESFGDDESAITGADDEFAAKNPLQKVWVLSAGVIMNFLFAWLIAISLVLVQGRAVVDGPFIGAVSPKMPASAVLKLEPNDRILSVDSLPTPTWESLTEVIHNSGGKEITLTWLRGADTLHGKATPLLKDAPDSTGTVRKVGLLGISPRFHYESMGIFPGIAAGHKLAWSILKGSTIGFLQLFTGASSIKELVGPIGIAQMSGESARSGLMTFFGFLMLISISVGMINILPFPILDGGHIAMVWIETMLGKTVPIEIKLKIQQVGIVFLLMMVIFVSYHDILRIWSGN